MHEGASVKRILLLSLPVLLLFWACTPMEEKRGALMDNARKLEASGQYAEAGKEAQKVLELDPTSVEAYRLMGRSDMNRKDWQSAKRNFARVLELMDPGAEAVLEALENLARIALFANDPTKAAAYAEKAAALDPSSPDVALIKAEIAMRKMDFTEAARLAQKVLATDPLDKEAIVLLATAYMNMKEPEQAKKLLTEALEKSPESITARNLLLNIAVQAKEYDEAEKHIKFLLERHPDSEELILQLCDIYLKTGKTQEIVPLLSGFLKNNPNADKARISLAEVFLAQDKTDEALKVLEQAPKASDTILLSKAGLLVKAGKIDEAAQTLRSLTESATAGHSKVAAQYGLAEVLMQQRKPKEAEQLLTRLYTENPQELRAIFLRSRLYAAQRRFAEAITDLETFTAKAPDDLPAVLALADVQYAAGLAVMAEDTVKKVIERTPEFLEAHMFLVSLYMAEEKPEQALKALRAGEKAIPGNQELIFAEADLLTHLKRYDEAVALLEKFSKNEKLRETALHRMATVYFEQGKHGKATGVYDRILKANPDSSLAVEGRIHALLAAKQADKALAFAEQRQKARPEDPAAAIMVGELALLNKKGPSAEKAFLRALALDPTLEQPLTRLVQLYSGSGRVDQAVKLCRSLLEKNSDNPGPAILLGIIQEQKGELTAAESTYRALLDKKPDELLAANSLAMLLTRHKPDAERLKEAETLAQKATASGAAATFDTLGWVQHLRGDNAAAEENLRKAHSQLQGTPSVTYRLAVVLAAQNDEKKRGEARSLLQGITGDKTNFAQKKDAQNLLNSLKKK